MRVAIVLAAGASRRWGMENKLFARIAGRPLLAHAMAAARAAPAGRILLVTGTQRARVAAAGRGPRVTAVLARDHRDGLGASLRAGLTAMRPAERLAFLFLGDMAAVPAWLPVRLLRALRPGEPGVRPGWRGAPGHPVLLRRPDARARRGLGGDRGIGRGLRTVPAPRAATIDLDRRTDRIRLRYVAKYLGTGRFSATPAKGQRWKTWRAGSPRPRR